LATLLLVAVLVFETP